MILHNRYYGHNAVLARYVGLSGDPPAIFGSVMHGWQPDPSDAYLKVVRWNSLVPLFLWNREHLDSARRRGHRNLRAIGSPFAYLMAMEPQKRSGPGSEGTVVIAPHSSDAAPIERTIFEQLKFKAESSSPAPWDLAVFYQDWPGVPHDLFDEDSRWRVCSFGRRYDEQFLSRLVDCFVRRRVVLAGSALSSGLLYATALGLEPYVIDGLWRDEDDYLSPEVITSWERRLGSAIAAGDAEGLANSQLGVDLLLEPAELKEALGWGGARGRLASWLGRAAYSYSGWSAVETDLRYPYAGPSCAQPTVTSAPGLAAAESDADSEQAKSDGSALGDVYGVLLTYRRPDDLQRSLDALLPLSERGLRALLVVDNDPLQSARDAVVARAALEPSLSYRAAGSNLGPAGGWALGMSQVLEVARDHDWIIILDDDDPMLSDELPRVFRDLVSQQVGDRIAGIGLGGKCYRLPWLVGSRRVDVRGSLRYVDALDSNNGAQYRVGALREVGVFDGSLFFGFEDLELGLRLRSRGYRLCVPPDLASQFRSQMEDRYRAKRGTVPGKGQLGPAGWKRYYGLRNSVVIAARYGNRLAAVLHATVRGIVKPLLYLPIRPRLALSHLQMNAAAIRDAALGRMGRNDAFLPAPAGSAASGR